MTNRCDEFLATERLPYPGGAAYPRYLPTYPVNASLQLGRWFEKGWMSDYIIIDFRTEHPKTYEGKLVVE